MQQGQTSTQASSWIDWRRLGLSLLLTLVLPVSLAIVIDLWLMTWPFLVIVTGLLCIPLATIVVMRIALAELKRVFEAVAPHEQEIDNETGCEVVDGDGCVVIAPDAKN